jgi:hypothetical protein
MNSRTCAFYRVKPGLIADGDGGAQQVRIVAGVLGKPYVRNTTPGCRSPCPDVPHRVFIPYVVDRLLKSLNLRAVEIHRDESVDAGSLEAVRTHPRRIETLGSSFLTPIDN